jgi:arsenite methyltransferase
VKKKLPVVTVAQVEEADRLVDLPLWIVIHNAVLEGVADLVTIETVDIRDLEFPAESFDVVTSSLVLHNLRAPADRRQVLENALRVLRPEGRLLLADIRNIDEYKRVLERCGAEEVAVRDFGLRAAFGDPRLRLRLVSCVRPPSRNRGLG